MRMYTGDWDKDVDVLIKGKTTPSGRDSWTLGSKFN